MRMTTPNPSPQPTAESGQHFVTQHRGTGKWFTFMADQGDTEPLGPFNTKEEAEAHLPVPAPPAESERVSADGPKPLSESAKAAILEIQDRTQREVIIPHYGTYHEQKKALFSQIKITNELREHCEKTEKLLVETQAKLAALLKPVERVSMSTEKAESPADAWQRGVEAGYHAAWEDGAVVCPKLRYRAPKSALLKPQGETPEGGGKEVSQALYEALSGLVDAIEDGGGHDENGDVFDVRKAVSALERFEAASLPPSAPSTPGSTEKDEGWQCPDCGEFHGLIHYCPADAQAPPSEPVSPLSETQQERADFARTNRSAWPNNSSESPLPQADDADEIELWADRMSSTFHTMNRIELVRAAWRAGKASR